MRERRQPLDPNSEAGKATAEALTAFLASVGPRVRQRRREREAAQAASEQKAA
jgi:hypothetical protein